MAAKEYLIRDGPSLDFNLGISYALLLSQFLLSTTYFDRSFIVVVDSLLMWTLTAVVAKGPRDAESWFRAETYYIRILNVSPVFAKSVFLMTRRVFAESVFVESVICWRGALLPSQFLLRHQFFALSVLLSQFFADKATWFSAETYYIRIIKLSPVLLSQFFWLSQLLLSLTRRVIAELDFVYSRVCVCVYCKRMKYTSKRRDIFDPYSKAQYMYKDLIRV